MNQLVNYKGVDTSSDIKNLSLSLFSVVNTADITSREKIAINEHAAEMILNLSEMSQTEFSTKMKELTKLTKNSDLKVALSNLNIGMAAIHSIASNYKAERTYLQSFGETSLKHVENTKKILNDETNRSYLSTALTFIIPSIVFMLSKYTLNSQKEIIAIALQNFGQSFMVSPGYCTEMKSFDEKSSIVDTEALNVLISKLTLYENSQYKLGFLKIDEPLKEITTTVLKSVKSESWSCYATSFYSSGIDYIGYVTDALGTLTGGATDLVIIIISIILGMISLYLAYRMLNSTAREIKVNIDSVQQHITMHDRTPPVKTKQIRDKSPPVTRPRTRASTKLLKNVDSGNGLRKSMKSKK